MDKSTNYKMLNNKLHTQRVWAWVHHCLITAIFLWGWRLLKTAWDLVDRIPDELVKGGQTNVLFEFNYLPRTGTLAFAFCVLSVFVSFCITIRVHHLFNQSGYWFRIFHSECGSTCGSMSWISCTISAWRQLWISWSSGSWHSEAPIKTACSEPRCVPIRQPWFPSWKLRQAVWNIKETGHVKSATSRTERP